MNAKCTIAARISIARAGLPQEFEDALRDAFEHKNPEFLKKKRMGLPAWSETPTIATWRTTDDVISVPRGRFKEVRTLAWKHGITLDVEDARVDGLALPDGIASTISLRPYQDAAIAEALRVQNCLVRSPTGSGKTTMGLAMIPKVGRWTLVLVDSGGIADEWLHRAREELTVAKEDVGYIGEGIFRPAPVTVALNQSLNAIRAAEKWRRIESSFGLVVADEVQTFAAATFRRTIGRIPAKYRIGVSDDHRRPDRKEFLIADEFGGIAYEVAESQLVEAGSVVDVGVILLPTRFRAPWYRQPSKTPFSGKSARLLQEIIADDDRNEQICDRIEEEVAAGRSFLVFSARIEHCRVLEAMLDARGIPSGLMLGGAGQKVQFRRTHEGLRSGEVRVGIGTYKSLGKGVNLPSVDRGFAVTPNATSLQPFRQMRGRMCRPKEGGGDAAIWYAWDVGPLGKKPARNLIKWSQRCDVWTPEGMIPAKQYLKEM